MPKCYVDAYGGVLVTLGSWGPKVENWPVAVVWASKALFGVLGSEPLAVFNPTWLLAWHFGSVTLACFLVVMTRQVFWVL